MELEAISGAAIVALASTIVFLLIARTYAVLSRSLAAAPSFSDRVMHEAAQRFRDELTHLSSTQNIYLSGTLVFAVLFVAAYGLQAQRLVAGYPSWQLYLQLGFLFLVCAYAAYRLLRTVMARFEIRFLRDANIAIGHQLQQLSASGTRVFHDVPTAAGIVDHVIIGNKGLYAVNVVARRSGKRTHARLRDNEIEFANKATDIPIVELAAKTARLQKEFRLLVGHNIRVRSVIALPGWEIGEQSNQMHLLVNERTIAMLSGWNEHIDHLMNEDIHVLHEELTLRCTYR